MKVGIFDENSQMGVGLELKLDISPGIDAELQSCVCEFPDDGDLVTEKEGLEVTLQDYEVAIIHPHDTESCRAISKEAIRNHPRIDFYLIAVNRTTRRHFEGYESPNLTYIDHDNQAEFFRDPAAYILCQRLLILLNQYLKQYKREQQEPTQ